MEDFLRFFFCICVGLSDSVNKYLSKQLVICETNPDTFYSWLRFWITSMDGLYWIFFSIWIHTWCVQRSFKFISALISKTSMCF